MKLTTKYVQNERRQNLRHKLERFTQIPGQIRLKVILRLRTVHMITCCLLQMMAVKKIKKTSLLGEHVSPQNKAICYNKNVIIDLAKQSFFDFLSSLSRSQIVCCLGTVSILFVLCRHLY